MNTPSPCNKCLHLYYDVMCEDDPSYMAECKLNLPIGNERCKKFKEWKDGSKLLTWKDGEQ